MRAVVQRVTQASVTVDGELLGRIGKGFLILLGVADGDTRQMAEKMADKICRLRMKREKLTYHWRMWRGNFWWSASLPCTRTAARETGPAL